MKTALLFLALITLTLPLLMLTSCAKDDTPVPPSQRYNTQGWNRPEPWEGGAGFGPLPQTR